MKFSIQLNGSSVGYFGGKCGSRQGDPISANIFIIVVELLTRILEELVRKKLFQLYPKCKEPMITSLMFADDLVIFCKPTKLTFPTIIGGLKLFYDITGLKGNLEKYEIM